MNKALHKWAPAVPKRKPDNILSSKAREKGQLGFTPTYEKEKRPNMSLLMNMEYMRLWYKERAMYEKDTYTREEIIKQENKIKRRFVQRMMTYRMPTKNQFIDLQFKERQSKPVTQKPSSHTTDYRYYKYKPECLGLGKLKNPELILVRSHNTKETSKIKGTDESNKNDEVHNNNNVIEAEIVCHGQCKCHPNS